MKRYEDWKEGSEPFYPNHILKQTFIVLLMIAAFAIAVVVVPDMFSSADGEAGSPQWFFLPLYALAKIIPGAGGFGIAIVAGAVILLMPLLDRNPKEPLRRRPALLAASLLFALAVIALGIAGTMK